jgi:hypothetical protein
MCFEGPVVKKETGEVAGRTIVARSGALGIEGYDSLLCISLAQDGVHVGCTTLTREAWRLLKELVDLEIVAADRDRRYADAAERLERRMASR